MGAGVGAEAAAGALASRGSFLGAGFTGCAGTAGACAAAAGRFGPGATGTRMPLGGGRLALGGLAGCCCGTALMPLRICGRTGVCCAETRTPANTTPPQIVRKNRGIGDSVLSGSLPNFTPYCSERLSKESLLQLLLPSTACSYLFCPRNSSSFPMWNSGVQCGEDSRKCTRKIAPGLE